MIFVNYGLVVLGKMLIDMVYVVEEFEELVKLVLMLCGMQVCVLSVDQIDDLLQVYGLFGVG